jgi:hypothetical protein
VTRLSFTSSHLSHLHAPVTGNKPTGIFRVKKFLPRTNKSSPI